MNEVSGLGTKKNRVMNECLLVKWRWWYGCELVEKIIDAKYYPSSVSWLPDKDSQLRTSRAWADKILIHQNNANLFNNFVSNMEIRV